MCTQYFLMYVARVIRFLNSLETACALPALVFISRRCNIVQYPAPGAWQCSDLLIQVISLPYSTNKHEMLIVDSTYQTYRDTYLKRLNITI